MQHFFKRSAPVFILDQPAHAGNVGASWRGLANMGFERLRLVAPRQFPHPDAIAYAAGAAEGLEKIEVFSDLNSALADVNFLVATSNRSRGQRHTVFTPRQLASRLPEIQARPNTQVGILFGTERTGLPTRDLERADVICNIPTLGTIGSLNLSQAVLLVAYELMLGQGEGKAFDFDPIQQGTRASTTEMDALFNHLEQTLLAIGFIKCQQKRHMMGSLRAMLHRAALDPREVAILRGILTEVISSRKRELIQC
ncbi:MAG: RNA methyltransferase [Magnetococcus sp. DMHC-6]